MLTSQTALRRRGCQNRGAHQSVCASAKQSDSLQNFKSTASVRIFVHFCALLSWHACCIRPLVRQPRLLFTILSVCTRVFLHRLRPLPAVLLRCRTACAVCLALKRALSCLTGSGRRPMSCGHASHLGHAHRSGGESGGRRHKGRSYSGLHVHDGGDVTGLSPIEMELETRHRHIQKNIESLCRWSPPSNVSLAERTRSAPGHIARVCRPTLSLKKRRASSRAPFFQSARAPFFQACRRFARTG